jgi:hypothetical protein
MSVHRQSSRHALQRIQYPVHLAGAREQAEREGDAGVMRVEQRVSPLSIRPTSMPAGDTIRHQL